jgi:ornithine cyclodeaminase
LRPGQHLDLIGSFTAAMCEVDDDALMRAVIFVDTRSALAESGELVHAFASGVVSEADVLGELSDLVRGTVGGRRSAEEITLFKSVGCAIEDLAAAELAVRASVPRRDPAD